MLKILLRKVVKYHDDQVTMFAQKIFIGKEIQQTSKYA